MEIGNELSDKIRSAIKAKLVDLGAYVDDELPDYIMVMVANKKTQEQMTEDLNLFLGSNTEKFTAWLSALLAKLKAVTNLGGDDDKEKTEAEKTPSKETSPPQKEKGAKNSLATTTKAAAADNAIDDLEPELTIKPDRDEFEEEERLEKKKAQLATQKSLSKAASKKIVAPKSSTEKVSVKATSIKARLGERVSPKSSSEASLAKKRKTPGSVVGSIVKRDIELEEEEYDPHKPMIGKVASTIRVGNRRSSVPLSHQASKSLVLKAVTEAHHSTEQRSSKMVSDQISRPIHRRLGALPRDSIKSGISSRNGNCRSQKSSSDRSVELFVRQKDDRSVGRMRQGAGDTHELETSDVRKIEIKRSESPKAEEDQPEADEEANAEEEEEAESSVRRIAMKEDVQVERIPETLIQSGADESDFTDEEENVEVPAAESPRVVTQKNPVLVRPSSPKFVVTLDGVDQKLVDKAMSADPEDYEMEMETELSLKRPSAQEISVRLGNEDDDDDLGPLKKSKMVERCRFWPACKVGNECEYHHPTVACTMFPRCKFGDKCLYIHPNCKFDANCTRPKCPYTHASQRGSSYPVVIQPVKILPVAKPSAFLAASKRISSQPKDISEVKCRFFPKCTNMSCPYIHPKPCRYGIGCTNKATCTFSHPALPSKDQLRWIPPKHSNVTIKLDEHAE